MKPEILRIEYISKSNNYNKVLKNICMNLFEGEIVKLVAREYESKSAFVEILGGVSQPDSGSIYSLGKEVQLTSPQIAQKIGINIIYQQNTLIPNLTVMENLFLGVNSTSRKLFINKRQQFNRSLEVLRVLGISVTPDTLVAKLTPDQIQLVQFGKALLNNPKILVIDYSVRVLNIAQEVFYKNVLKELSKKKVTVLILSSDIVDFTDIAEKIYIMRAGSIIGNIKTNMLDLNQAFDTINTKVL